MVTELLENPVDDVPDSITNSMRAQVARLTGKVERLVKLVSVVPGRTELALIQDIDVSLEGSIGDRETLQMLGMVDDAISFHHELARAAVERSLSEPERRRLNQLVLKSGEALGFDVSRLAHHARRAHDVEAMVRLLPEAARAAAKAKSHREALMQLKALEPYLDRLSTRDRADVQKLWSTEEGLVSGRGIHHAVAAAESHIASGDHRGFGSSLLSAARSGWFSHMAVSEDTHAAFKMAKRAVDEMPDSGSPDLADAYAYLAHHAMVRIQHASAISYAQKALELAPGPNATRCVALICLGVVRNEKSYPDGNALLLQAKQMADSLDLQRERWWAQLNLVLGAAANKEITTARCFNDAIRAELGDDDLAVTSFHISKVAEFAILGGDYESARSTLEDLERRVDGDVWWLAWSRALLDVRTGRPDSIDRSHHLRSLARTLNEPHPMFHAATTWAELLYVRGHKDAEITKENLDMLATAISFDVPAWITDLGLWLWLDGHIDEVPELAASPLHLVAGGRWKEAADWFDRRGLPYEQAVCLSLGDQASRILALEICDRIGAQTLAAKFRRRLRADGVKGIPRGPWRDERRSKLGMTTRQDEVLTLLSERLTNAEIADRLFISSRTVEKHVAAVMAKLGASDRREAVELARAAGWRPGNG